MLAAGPALLLCKLLGRGAQLETDELVLDVCGGLETVEPEHCLAASHGTPHHTALPCSNPLAHRCAAVTMSTNRAAGNTHEAQTTKMMYRNITNFLTGLTMSLRVMGQMTFTLLGITTMPSSPTTSFTFPCTHQQQHS